MKKSVLFMTAALAFGVAGAQAPVTTTAVQAPALTDVPAGHWAKDAVERLVSEGIILGYPDGTYRGTQTLTRYEAAMIINRLLDRMGSGDVVIGDIDDATMVALRNAINELSAQGADFEVRLADLEANAVSQADFARLEGRVDALATTGTDNTDVAGQLATINDLATLLNQDVLELQDRVIAVDGELATFDDRLGLVENQVVENTQVLAGHELRVSDLENGRVKLTLGIKGGYGKLDLIKGDKNFDIDRITNDTFAKEVFSDNDGDVSKTDTEKADGFEGGVTLGVKATNIVAGDNIFVEEAGVNFGTTLATLDKSTKLGLKEGKADKAVVTLESAEVTGTVADAARFRIKASSGSVALRPDVVNPVGKLADKKGYNDYLLPSGGRNGVAAGVALTDLPLQPTLYLGAGYGEKPNLYGPWFAARAETKLGTKGDIGVSFANNFATRTDNATTFVDHNDGMKAMGRTAFGIDASYTEPALDNEDTTLYGVKALYVASLPKDVFDAAAYPTKGADGKDLTFADLWEVRDEAAVVKGEANFFNLGAKLELRSVSPGFGEVKPTVNGKELKIDGLASMDVDRDDDFKEGYANEKGARASVATKVGIAEVGAFGDVYTKYTDKDWDDRKTAFGAHAGANLSAFRIVGFGGYATENSNTGANVVDTLKGTKVKRADIFKPAKATSLYEYTSSVGALVTHDGSQANPLVPNLNIAIADSYFYDSKDNLFSALAAYDVKAIDHVTVTPFVGYSRYDKAGGNDTALKYGVEAKSNELAVAFKPQLTASVAGANYTSQIKDSTATTGSEIGAKVELGLNEFFSPSTKLSLGYGYHQANDLKDASSNPADFAFGTKGVAGMVGSQNTQTQGVFTQLAWNKALKLNYGVFVFDDNTKDTNSELNVAQGFKVSYGVKF